MSLLSSDKSQLLGVSLPHLLPGTRVLGFRTCPKTGRVCRRMEPLPPNPEDIVVCVEHPDIDSNLRTMPRSTAGKKGSIQGSSTLSTSAEPRSGVNTAKSRSRFKGFEPIRGDSTHTVTLRPPQPPQPPQTMSLNSVVLRMLRLWRINQG